MRGKEDEPQTEFTYWCVECYTCNNVGPEGGCVVGTGFHKLDERVSCEQSAHAGCGTSKTLDANSLLEQYAPVPTEHDLGSPCAAIRDLPPYSEVGEPVRKTDDSRILTMHKTTKLRKTL